MSIGIPGIGIGLTRGGSLDADAAAWAAAVVANSGTYSAATLAAMSTFVKSAKASGYWTKLNRINLFAGDQLAAALVPLKAGGGSAKDTAVNFVSGDYSESTGLTGNGSTKHLKTGLIPSASLTENDTHIAVHILTAVATTLGSAAMAFQTTATPAYFSDQYNTTTGRVSGAVSGGAGFGVGSRRSGTDHEIYRNGTSIATNATASGSISTVEQYILAINNAGTPGSYSAASLGGYSFGAGLTDSDVTAYAAHMEAFQDALGRGVA